MEKTKLMTYRELSEALGIKIDSAKALRRRKKWSLSLSNSSRESLVNVPLEFLDEERQGTHVSSDITTDKNHDLHANVISQIASAHETIGELKLKLSLALELNKTIDGIEEENYRLKSENENKDTVIKTISDELKLKNEEYIALKILLTRKKNWWSYFIK